MGGEKRNFILTPTERITRDAPAKISRLRGLRLTIPRKSLPLLCLVAAQLVIAAEPAWADDSPEPLAILAAVGSGAIAFGLWGWTIVLFKKGPVPYSARKRWS